jgi:hypothetical protein
MSPSFFTSMSPPHRNNTADTLTAIGVTLRAVRDSADAFPPLKSAATALMTVVEMSQKAKANRKNCKRLATRAAEIVDVIYRQTKDYSDGLPAEVQGSIEQIERIFRDIIDFMKEQEDQTYWRAYARQDTNKSRIDEYQQLLEEAIVGFGINLQLSALRIHAEALHMYAEASRIGGQRHDEVLVVSHMSEAERLQLLTKMQRDLKLSNSISFFFFLRFEATL